MKEDVRKSVDLLVKQFWKRGYLTISRRFGTYLPEPGKVGDFDVDIVARHKNDYAIGIYFSHKDFMGDGLAAKINYLASRHTKYTDRRVKLFVGVPAIYFKQAKIVLEQLEPDIRKNVKLFQIADNTLPSSRKEKRESNALFS